MSRCDGRWKVVIAGLSVWLIVQQGVRAETPANPAATRPAAATELDNTLILVTRARVLLTAEAINAGRAEHLTPGEIWAHVNRAILIIEHDKEADQTVLAAAMVVLVKLEPTSPSILTASKRILPQGKMAGQGEVNIAGATQPSTQPGTARLTEIVNQERRERVRLWAWATADGKGIAIGELERQALVVDARSLIQFDYNADDATLAAALTVLMKFRWDDYILEIVANRLAVTPVKDRPLTLKQILTRTPEKVGWLCYGSGDPGPDMPRPAIIIGWLKALQRADPAVPQYLVDVAVRADPERRMYWQDRKREFALQAIRAVTDVPDARQLSSNDWNRIRRSAVVGGPDYRDLAGELMVDRKQMTAVEQTSLKYDIPDLFNPTLEMKSRTKTARRLASTSADLPLISTALEMTLEGKSSLVRRAVTIGLRDAQKVPAPLLRSLGRLVDRGPAEKDNDAVESLAIDDAVALVARAGDKMPAEVSATFAAMLSRDDRRDLAEFVLAAAGPAALPRIASVYAMAQRDPGTRAAATRTLSQPELSGKEAEGLLMTILKADASAEVRSAAAAGLGRSQHLATPARAALVASLKDSNRDVRVSAALALVQLRPPDDMATDAAQALVTSADAGERVAGAALSSAIGVRAASRAIPDLLRMADNTNPIVRWSASSALARLDPDGRQIGKAVIAAVKWKDQPMLDRLKPAIERGLDPATAGYLKILAAEDPDLQVRRFAQQVVGAGK